MLCTETSDVNIGPRGFESLRARQFGMPPRGVMVVAPHACWQGNECWQPIGNRPFYVDSFPEMPETTSIWLNSRVSADAKWNRPGQVYLVEAMSRSGLEKLRRFKPRTAYLEP